MATLSTGETYAERFWGRMKREPLIPAGASAALCAKLIPPTLHRLAGLLLTTGVFGGVVYHARKGNQRQLQLWMRARVLAQGLTVVAIVWGFYRLQQDSVKYNEKIALEVAMVDEEKARERAAFEERLREAEVTYEAEAHAAKSWFGSKGSDAVTPTESSGKRWYQYLGWSQSTSKSDSDKKA
ncbi:hypothetical protein IW261DRAFT_1458319 [Armillaria novae-zelandiae]|uniref:HIG1 domain-containing protein n=1 Tax=Armillaria novae-zelandiae TaxID=153914 RepID=A0AA39PK74_9AGAR|nr:hypothetical protein IW261DRAFT_1458319 [Armillaria novae-zelandiae]